MKTIKEHKVYGCRWTPIQSLDDGSVMAHAYGVDNPHSPFVQVNLPAGSTENQAFDALRIQLTKRYRLPVDTAIVNDRGDRINVGGTCQ
jgi:hypothetical protein